MRMKDVESHEVYCRNFTQYLTVKTKDEWIYRFKRPKKQSENHPFVFEKRQRPDGTWSESSRRLPDSVVEYVQDKFDVANLHSRPSSLR